MLHAFLPPEQSPVYTKNFDKVQDTFNKGLSQEYKQKEETSLSLYFLETQILPSLIPPQLNLKFQDFLFSISLRH